MDTDRNQPDLQGASNRAVLPKQETHAIIGCGFEVLNELDHGLGLTLNFKHSRLE
jgi:hypothetical protein